jgi:hypothetical protein
MGDGAVPITEQEIRESALQALSEQKSGFLTTESLIAILTRRLSPTGTDAETLNNRNDTHFSQKVRNLVSHRDSATSLESRGLAIYLDDQEGWQITDKGREYVDN